MIGRLLRALCQHPFGWSYTPHRTRRYCRVCALEQVLEPCPGCGAWECPGSRYRGLRPGEAGGMELERAVQRLERTMAAEREGQDT